MIKGIIKSGEYFDSVTLMQVAKKLTELEGITDAAAVMGTMENKSILSSSGLLLDIFSNAADAELLIAVSGETAEAVDAAMQLVDDYLKESRNRVDDAGEYHPKSLEGALPYLPGANLAVISVAGKYAGDEAYKALKAGLHVMIFSDNVSVPMEKKLKEIGRDNGLLVMGPDCGTAIINGVPLAFANVVNRGNIGIAAASGTGLQEISCIISNEGAGISQAIGTGGRDVKSAIGGIMVLEALRALEQDAQTDVIVLVCKPPDSDVLEKIKETVGQLSKPVVGAILGWEADKIRQMGMHAADTLEENALLAVALSKGMNQSEFRQVLTSRDAELRSLARAEKAKLQPNQAYIRGLFSGGTLCDETQMILDAQKLPVYSNTPLKTGLQLEDAWKSQGHTIIDLGDDEFTVGRPHPMIDYSLRNRRMIMEANDPETAVILLDVVLGYGSNMNAGTELSEAVQDANAAAVKQGRHVSIICSITGTPGDPQNKDDVQGQLKNAGALILPSNAAASRLATYIVNKENVKGDLR